ncbi:MAG: hypothetical protein ACRDFS_01840, partial [Chloroflexota bacterium]
MLTFLRAHRQLLFLALASELIYLGCFVSIYGLLAHFSLPYSDLGGMTGHSRLAGAVYVASFSALFMALLLAWRAVRRDQGPATLPIILVTGGVLWLTAIFIYPVTALDVFAYIP